MRRCDYVRKYSKIYADIPEKNRKKADEIIGKLADVLIMMDNCQTHIKSEGLVTKMDQGKYEIDRENPWSKVYDAKAKLYIALIEKLDKMVPDSKADTVAKAGENLAKLVAGGKPVELR